jgi:1-acyl-sn-glycerol-3-phosphate acyltransferase
MPLVHLLYRCPSCGHDPMTGKGDRASCVTCGAEFRRGGEGGMIRVLRGNGIVSEHPGAMLVKAIEAARISSPEMLGESGELRGRGDGNQASEETVSSPAAVTVRMAEQEMPVRFRGELVGFFESLGEEGPGILELTEDGLVLKKGGSGVGDLSVYEGVDSDTWYCKLLEIGAIQSSSSAVQIAPRNGGLIHFRFLEDSPKRWDELLQDALRNAYRASGLGEIAEFQPRIVVAGARDGGERVTGHQDAGGWEGPSKDPGPRAGDEEVQRGERREPLVSWYGLFRGLAGVLVRLGVRLDVSGVENIPATGPFVLVANHQSILDPILVQSACPRHLHTLTKSTQFSSPAFRWLLTRVKGIPTRRYRVDPQVVRVVLRRLGEGKGVGIYPEGERSWDGTLQPFRQGTIRLLLKAGVPVVPCGIDGSYDAWPRWSRVLKRRRVSLRFGEPIRWRAIDNRRERDGAVLEAEERLKDSMVSLGAWRAEAGGI